MLIGVRAKYTILSEIKIILKFGVKFIWIFWAQIELFFNILSESELNYVHDKNMSWIRIIATKLERNFNHVKYFDYNSSHINYLSRRI